MSTDFLSVEEYLFHRNPMILVDRLLDLTSETAKAVYQVKEDNPFLESRGLPNWVGIEIMAQTIALYSGAHAKIKGRNINMGFLLGTRKMEMNQPYYQIGSYLISQVEKIVFVDNSLGQFSCQLFLEDKLVSQAILSVFESQV